MRRISATKDVRTWTRSAARKHKHSTLVLVDERTSLKAGFQGEGVVSMNSSDLSNEVKLRIIQIPFELSVLPVCLETRRSAWRILLGLRTLQQELPDNDERVVKTPETSYRKQSDEAYLEGWGNWEW